MKRLDLLDKFLFDHNYRLSEKLSKAHLQDTFARKLGVSQEVASDFSEWILRKQ